MNINIYKFIKFIYATTIYYYIIARLTLPIIDKYIFLRGIIFAIASLVLGKVYKNKWITS